MSEELPENRDVDHANHVNTADNVDTAAQAKTVISAEHVDMVQNVKNLQLTKDQAKGLRTPILEQVFKVSIAMIVLAALALGILSYIDKHFSENRAEAQSRQNAVLLEQMQIRLDAADKATSDRLTCVRRYQDKVDSTTTETLVDIGELVVVITQVVPGPGREAAVAEKITQLGAATKDARDAVNAKIIYNNDGNPLPCPIEETEVTSGP